MVFGSRWSDPGFSDWVHGSQEWLCLHQRRDNYGVGRSSARSLPFRNVRIVGSFYIYMTLLSILLLSGRKLYLLLSEFWGFLCFSGASICIFCSVIPFWIEVTTSWQPKVILYLLWAPPMRWIFLVMARKFLLKITGLYTFRYCFTWLIIIILLNDPSPWIFCPLNVLQQLEKAKQPSALSNRVCPSTTTLEPDNYPVGLESACHVLDARTDHRCYTDEDCGVDSVNCIPRECSAHGYCGDWYFEIGSSGGGWILDKNNGSSLITIFEIKQIKWK